MMKVEVAALMTVNRRDPVLRKVIRLLELHDTETAVGMLLTPPIFGFAFLQWQARGAVGRNPPPLTTMQRVVVECFACPQSKTIESKLYRRNTYPPTRNEC